MVLLDALNRRYATKKFDPTQKLSEDQIHQLLQAIQLAPTAYGLQPFKVIVVKNPELKKQLRTQTRDQPQVTECSHYLIFAIVKGLPESYIQEHLDNVATIRNIPREALNAYQEKITTNLKQGERAPIIDHRSAHQAYIALGFLLTAAADMQVDSCAIEGFLPAEYNNILDLEAQGLSAVVCCALGKRSIDDNTASFKKVRRSLDSLIIYT